MKYRLKTIAGPDAGREFSMTSGRDWAIGRGNDCAVKLNDPSVSRVHCRIRIEGGRAVLSDAGSSWGTQIDGQDVEEHRLQPGDVIRMGDSELRFEVVTPQDEATMAPGQDSTARAARLAARGAASPGKPARPAVTTPRPQEGAAAAGQLDNLVGQHFVRYDIHSIEARARTGIVFRATDTEKDRPVALKVLWPELTSRDTEMRRFVRAIKTMMPVRHPNIVALYGAGKSRDYCWTALEFVEGESLAKVIDRMGIGGMLDWEYGFRVAMHVARALEVAHENNIVHRNITPANILIRESDGVAKLGDLMLAKALEGTNAESITRSGELVGELIYMAGEQTTGERNIDTRTDIYNLGATVYHLLTGRPPHKGNHPTETIQKIQAGVVDPPTKYQLSIPGQFEGIVVRMLARDPAHRFQTPATLIRDLERVAKFQGLTSI